MKLFTHGTLAIACGLTASGGLLVVSLGPLLPDLPAAAYYSLSVLGSVFTAFAAGGLLGQLIAGGMHDRLSFRPVLLASGLLLALGMVGITLSVALPTMLVAALLAGAGFGSLLLALNLLVAGSYPGRSTGALNLLNVFFGVGAIAGPIAVSLAGRAWGTGLPAIWGGIALLLLLLPLSLLTASPLPLGDPGKAPARRGSVYRTPMVWTLALLLLLYVGSEVGLSGWLKVYLERSTGLAPGLAALGTSLFWLALTLGRIGGTLLSGRMAPMALLGWSLAGLTAGMLGLLASVGNLPPSLIALAVIGLCCGPVFPTVVALTTAAAPHQQGAATGLVTALGNGGALVLPWLQGLLIEQRGPQAAVLLLVGCAGAMLLVFRGLLAAHAAPAAAVPNCA